MAEEREEKILRKRQNKEDITRSEHDTLKGIENEDLGVYSELFSAKSGIDGQDGGIATALLIEGMKNGVFNAAVVVRRKEGEGAEAIIAKDTEEILAARGTKYIRIRVTPKLRELVDQGKKKMAIVCTPCEVRAVRKLQQTLKRDSSDVEITVIGLFCLEAFNYSKLKAEIERLLGINVDAAEKTQIHEGKFTVLSKGKEYSCKVKDLDNAVEKGCHYCDDFAARLADISVGSVGSKRGYSTVIVRSDAGKQLLKSLKFAKARVEKEEIVKLCRLKKKRAEKNLSLAQRAMV
jgi:coenzyme F420-reducing hydrogenase beta subunit